MIRFSIGMKLALGSACALAVLGVVGAVAYVNTAKLIDTRDWVSHSHEVIAETAELKEHMMETIANQRGYVLTHEDAFIASYETASAAIGADIDQLTAKTADNPRQQGRLRALRPQIASLSQLFAATIELAKQKAPMSELQTSQVETLMASIRPILAEMENEEDALLKQRDAEADRTAQLTFETIIFGPLVGALLLAGIGFAITRSITAPVRNTVIGLASMTAEILAGTAQQASGVQEQAAAVAETMTTVDEIVQTSEQATERVKAVTESSRRAVEVGNAGRQAVEDSVRVMGAVKEQSESVAESILGLAERAQAIGEIIAAVNDIADQTNLLALNAAIEASRAGEHGRGFSIVAGEIKALADQSKKATTQVRQILGEIQKATNGAVIATEQGTKSVNDAIRTVNEAGGTIKALTETIAEAARAAAQITASVGQQSAGMAQIQQAMESINLTTNQNLASTKQAERAAKDLNALGGSLKQLLAMEAA